MAGRTRIPTVTIDLNKADGYAVDDTALIIAGLELHGLYGDQYLYTVFDASALRKFRQTGTYRDGDTIYASKGNELCEEEKPGSTETLKKHLGLHDRPVMAVYDGTKFVEGGLRYEYRFRDPGKKPEAVKAVVKFKGFM